MSLKNDLILRAAKGEKTERTPVWLMRQAGRILPEYRAIRQKLKSFKELVTNPELAAEVTIQPVERLGVDAAIIFSDILVIPEAMGLPYQVIESKGPVFKKTIRNLKDVETLKIADPVNDLQYVIEAIKITKKELNGKVPLIGFAGAPWTVFAYMIEGQGSSTFAKARKMLYTEPELSHILLQKITASTINYLNAQINAGADIVQLFDSWAGILPTEQYREFSLKYISQICDSIHNSKSEIKLLAKPPRPQRENKEKTLPSLPRVLGEKTLIKEKPLRSLRLCEKTLMIVFAKGAWFARNELAGLNCEVIGLDWNMDIKESRAVIGDAKTLQGNLDPCILYSSFGEIRVQTKKMLKEFGPFRHIANLGHGVYPDTEVEKVKCFVDTVKENSA